MRRSPISLDPLKLLGALAGGVRSYFESVSQEPLTAELMELLHKMDAEAAPERSGDHGRGVAKVDRIDRGG
jgi:hypothetical protein